MTTWLPDLSRRSGPAYLALAATLMEDIESGKLPPGFRLPTQRELAYALGLSITTVTNAYAVVLKRGLISGHVGRGTFVTGDRISSQFPEQPERGVIDCSLNRPVGGAAEKALAAALAEMSKGGNLSDLLDYGPSAGLPRHRAAGAEWLNRFGVAVPAGRVVVCAGAQHAYTVAASTLLSPGDVAIAEALTSPLLVQLSRLLQLRLHGAPIDEHGLIPEALDDLCRLIKPRVLFCTPNLHDPTGSVLPEERRKRIASISARTAA